MALAKAISNGLNNPDSYDYVCVIDYEATCEQGNSSNYPHEIIEFPIVLINLKTMKIEDWFHEYVRPLVNPTLSEFCTKLTGITQDQVNQADTFDEVMIKANKWIAQKELGSRYKFVCGTDGPWDFQKFLTLQCYHSKIRFPYWAHYWVDIRKMFAQWYNTHSRGVTKMLGYFNLSFEGNKHSGLDDSKNIARILIKILQNGCPLKLNNYVRTSLTDFEENPHELQRGIENEFIAQHIIVKNEVEMFEEK